MNISVLLTGRGNNSLSDKNVISVLGKPLLWYPATAGKNVKGASSHFVSSENDKILNEAHKVGYTKIVRPDEMAQPNSKHVDCIIHALHIMKKDHGIVPEILVVLLANSATIKSAWIDEAISIMQADMSISSVIPVQKNNDHHPFRAKKIIDGLLQTFVEVDENVSTNRQDLESCYYACHNFWVLNLTKVSPPFEKGQLPWKFMGEKIVPYVIEHSLDVHNQDDIFLTEMWLKNNK